MPPIRLALCITDLDVGGAERCLQQLATGLDRSRFEPAVYCLGPRPQDPQASCAAPIEAAGIPVKCLGAESVLGLPGVLRRLSRLLREQSPQIVQTFLFHANFLGRIAAKSAGVPHVVSGIRVAERHSRWHLWLDRVTARLVERHVCVSQSVAEFSAKKARIPRDRIVVIPNGIDPVVTASVAPADLSPVGVDSNRPVVTFVGRLEKQKGLTWLLETATEWLGQTGSNLLIVGSGSQKPSLEAEAIRLGIAKNVHFAGWRPDVLEILAASDLLVLPSRWEGMANVVLQAMALGLPVLATDVEGTGELLGPNADPQTVAYGDTGSLVKKMVAMIEDRTGSRNLGRNNRLRAESEFSLAKMIDSYQVLWETLVNR